MPNLLITTYCNRSCPYCFAQGKISGSKAARAIAKTDISLENAAYVVDFLKRSDHRFYSLLGGEPTLHPQFREIVDYALAKDMTVRVFTNGLMSTEVRKHIFRNNISLILNINEPRDTPAVHWEKLQEIFENLGPNICPGFNIYREDFDLLFLFDLIDRYRFSRAVRLGITQPINQGSNVFLPAAKYRLIGKRLSAFSLEADRRNIRLNFDCGFVLCMFNKADLGKLIAANADLKFTCGPTIDIDPDLNTWSCFPLSAIHNRNLKDFADLRGIVEYYAKVLGRYAQSGMYPKCRHCRFLQRKQCPGGCVSHKMRTTEAGCDPG
jgi:sulfatase maturation enzyme AslB (radical SAM superfamily)